MSTTANALYLPVPGRGLVPLDLDEETVLLPTFQANDRTDPSTIQSDYTVEVTLPETGHNRRLLLATPYAKLSATLTSGGVETLPLATLYVKGYGGGRITIQLTGGNRRFVDALKKPDGSDKRLADLSWPVFEHNWTPENIGQYLPYAWWLNNGWGYEIYDRGKLLNLQQLDPYGCYPSVAAWFILAAIVQGAGFTSNDLRQEPLFAALNVPAANPYTFSDDYRKARGLEAGYFFRNDPTTATYYKHDDAFPEELLNFSYVSQTPYFGPDSARTGASYFGGRYVAGTLGYYDIAASVSTFLEINNNSLGRIRCKFQLKVNRQVVFDASGSDGHDELETHETVTHTFAPKLNHYLLHPRDEVTLWWQGQEINLPSGTHWRIGATGSRTPLLSDYVLANEVKLTVTLLPDFPQGGVVRLQDWLPDMTQLDFVKSIMLVLGLTIQCDPYDPRLTFTPGNKLLANVPRARNWSGKLDRARPLGRVPERELLYRFGNYARTSFVRWTADDAVTAGTGDGYLSVADAALDASTDLATLPFAASQPSPSYPTLLRILNFTPQDAAATPVVYNAVTAKPRLTLRQPDGDIQGFYVAIPASSGKPAVLLAFATTPSYFASPALSLDLNATVLTTYWADVRAMLDEARYLKERFRLTAQDVASLDYSIPVWVAELGDFFAVSKVTEFDARRSTEVELCRLNASHLPAPALPDGQGQEFYEGEFNNSEWY